MAKMFSMFDPTKEGKGVKKQEKQKKGFFAFFETYFRYFWNYALMGVAYWVTSIGLVTNGLAKAGFTHIVRSTNRGKHSFMLSDYIDTIKKNWKQCLILGTINAFVTAILAVDLYYFYNRVLDPNAGLFEIIGLGAAFFIGITVVFMKYYVWTMAITFGLTTKQIIKNSFHFVFLNIGRNFLVSVILGIIYAALYLLFHLGNALILIFEIAFLLFIFPGLKTSLIQVNVFPSIKKFIIDPYYAEHKGEDIEKRRALGLDIPEDELPPEEREEINESVFTDVVPEKDKK